MTAERTLIVGIGSPHGDDQVGWLVAEQLAVYAHPDHLEVRQAKSPADVLDWLLDIDRLIICDACRGLGRVGEIRRWIWPTADIPDIVWSGTHDLCLPAVLTLADRLGRLPRHVVLWAIEGVASEALARMSTRVSEAMPQLVDLIIRDMRRNDYCEV